MVGCNELWHTNKKRFNVYQKNWKDIYICCYIRPGYHSCRSVNLGVDHSIKLNWKIEKGDNGPIYRAYTEEDPLVDISSTIIGSCVNKALQALGVNSKKHWSGFEYFGFMKSDFMEKLTQIDLPTGYCNNDNDFVSEDHNKDVNKDTILQKLHNVRKRNGGTTSSLCPKAVKT